MKQGLLLIVDDSIPGEEEKSGNGCQYNNNNSEFNNYTMSGSCWDISTKKCSRDTQLDRFQIQYPLRPSKQEAFFAVYDGHNSEQVAEYLSQELHKLIIQNAGFNNKETRAECITQSFLQADEQIVSIKKLKGGSTAIVGIIIEAKLYIINLGDSEAKMVKSDKKIKSLNKRHVVGDQQEKQLLQEKGALILDRGQTERINGKLAVSRSFGDQEYKQFICANPQIEIYDINSEDEYLLLASDGFWENINDEGILKEVDEFKLKQSKFLENTQKENGVYEQQDDKDRQLSRQLLNVASDMTVSSSKKDNMTLISIDIQKLIQENNKIKIKQQQELKIQNTDIAPPDTSDQMSTENQQPKKAFTIGIQTGNNQQQQGNGFFSDYNQNNSENINEQPQINTNLQLQQQQINQQEEDENQQQQQQQQQHPLMMNGNSLKNNFNIYDDDNIDQQLEQNLSVSKSKYTEKFF